MQSSQPQVFDLSGITLYTSAAWNNDTFFGRTPHRRAIFINIIMKQRNQEKKNIYIDSNAKLRSSSRTWWASKGCQGIQEYIIYILYNYHGQETIRCAMPSRLFIQYIHGVMVNPWRKPVWLGTEADHQIRQMLPRKGQPRVLVDRRYLRGDWKPVREEGN